MRLTTLEFKSDMLKSKAACQKDITQLRVKVPGFTKATL